MTEDSLKGAVEGFEDVVENIRLQRVLEDLQISVWTDLLQY